MGIANLLDAKNVFIIVSGKHKAAIVNRILNEPVSEAVPATLLRNHPGLVLYVDKDAASLISAGNDCMSSILYSTFCAESALGVLYPKPIPILY